MEQRTHSYSTEIIDHAIELEGRGKGGAGGFIGPDEAPDSLRSKSFATVLNLIGEGPADGFCDVNGNLIKDAKIDPQTFRFNATTGAVEFVTGKETATTPQGKLKYILEPGEGYPANTVIPCLISSPTTGTAAVIQAVTNALGQVSHLKIGAGGDGYSNDITAIVEGGIRADGVHATVTVESGDISSGKIISATVQDGGSGYLSAPTIRFVDDSGNGSGAYGVGVLNNDGTLASVDIKGGGDGYSFENTASNYIEVQPYPITGTAIKLDGIPLQASDLSFNFKEVEVNYVLGDVRQEVLEGFEIVESAVDNLNASLLTGADDTNGDNYFTTFTITNPTTTRVRINILLNALLKQSKSTGDIEPTDLEFIITYDYYRSNGDLPAEASGTVGSYGFGNNGGVYRLSNKKTSSQYEMSLEAAVKKDPEFKNHKWVFKVVRKTPNRNRDPNNPAESNPAYGYNDSFRVASAFSLSDTQLFYPNSVLVGIRINAEQFARLPTMSFRMRHLRMLVPTNYFPPGTIKRSGPHAGTRRITGEYCRDLDGNDHYSPATGDVIEQEWDGSFYLSWTNNASWVCYNICNSKIYGVGQYLRNISKWVFYKIGKFCDVLVDDGYGGKEPRFTANTYIQVQEDALKVLQDFASVFRGILMMYQGNVMPIQDAPQVPVMIFNPANVEGDFHYAGTSLKNRYTAAVMRYIDRTLDGKPGYVLAEDYEAILKYGIRTIDLSAFATASKGQGFRMGRLFLFSQNNETDLVSFTIGTVGRTLHPGLVIGVADPAKSGVDYSGRVKRKGVNLAGNSIIYCDRYENIVDLDGNGVDAAEFKASSFTLTLVDPDLQIRLGEIDNEEDLEDYAKTHLKKYKILSFGKDEDGHQIITVDGQVPATILPGTLYAIERTEVKVRQFRIATLEAVDGSSFQKWQLSAQEFQPQKYEVIEKGIQFDPEPTSFDLADWHLPGKPQDLIVTTRNVTNTATGEESYIVAADWLVPARGYVTGYEVYMRRNLGNWVKVGEVQSTQFEYPVTIVDTYCVKVHALGISRSKSEGVIGCAEVIPTTDIDGDGTDDVLVPGDGEDDIPGTPGTPRIVTGVTWRTYEIVSGLEVEGMASQGFWDTDDEVWKHSFDAKDVNFEWRHNNPRAYEFGGEGRNGAEFGDLSSDFRDYIVSIYDPNSLGGPVLVRKTGKVSRFEFLHSVNSSLIGGPYRDFIIGVQAKTASKVSKEKTMRCALPGPAKLQVAFGTPPDETYVEATVTDDGQLQLLFPDRETVGSKGFRLWLDTIQIPATPLDTTDTVRDTQTLTMSIGLLDHDTVYYFRVAELDDFGPGELSDEYSFTASNPAQPDAFATIGL